MEEDLRELCLVGDVRAGDGSEVGTKAITCNVARSIASWPMWLEEKEATRSSTEMLMAGGATAGSGERRMARGKEETEAGDAVI